jgi:hypothetical protein
MPLEYLRDGDLFFVGLNSRDNPSALSKGYVSKAQNFRMDRGVASVRKGTRKYSDISIVDKQINGCGVYLDQFGQEIMILVLYTPATTGEEPTPAYSEIVTFNPDANDWGGSVQFPTGETVDTSVGCDVVQANNYIFISRGHNKPVIRWEYGTINFLVLSHTNNHEFPHCSGLMYYQNRLVALGRHKSMSASRARDSVCVSNFLDFNKFDLVDTFTINQGGNDEIVSVVPWTMNEFLIMMRNSIFYLNVGSDRYSTGDPLSSDAFLQTMSTDVGCSAKRSAVQVAGGVVFLSDTGVYFLQPQQVGAAEGMRLTTLSEPLSATIDDVIARINKNHVSKSVAIYWNSRYYLAVPLDGSTKNNAVLVYNFILKAWESVDIYPEEFDAFVFLVAKKGTQRRMFAVDSSDGVFLMEENNWDEHGNDVGNPYLTVRLPFRFGGSDVFRQRVIQGEIVTRRFTFDSMSNKRFSSVEADLLCPAAAAIETYAEMNNPDTTSLLDNYGSPSDEAQDTTRRNPVRKIGYGLQVRFKSTSNRPSVRGVLVVAKPHGKNNLNVK